jgi:hypothetical protein
MKIQYHQNFISRTLKNLKTALFIDDSQSLIKLPTNVIDFDSMDNEGNAWFTLRDHFQYLQHRCDTFYCHLQFYNKKCNYYALAEGYARITTHQNYIHPKLQLQIVVFDYFFTAKRTRNGIIRMLEKMINWMLNDGIEPLWRLHFV